MFSKEEAKRRLEIKKDIKQMLNENINLNDMETEDLVALKYAIRKIAKDVSVSPAREV